MSSNFNNDGVTRPPKSIFRVFGYSAMECGYCKGNRAHLVKKTASDCSKSYGMLADEMTAEAYERFLSCGWRRSGIHLYKPCNFESCCPTLTIRLAAPKFSITKSQQKVLNKMQNLLHSPSRKAQKRKRSSLSAELAVLEGSGMLHDLQKSTQQALERCLAHYPEGSHRWNISFKARKPSKQDQKQGKILLVSSICAQIAGKLQLKREELVQTVVSAIQTPDPKSDMSVLSIRSHAKSGQILVTLVMKERSRPDVPMLDATQIDDVDDKLDLWYKTTTGKVLKAEQRKLEVTTLAAHESALLPEVHRLYAHYQHVVHQDPDPFTTGDTPPDKDGPLDWGKAPAYFTNGIVGMLEGYCQGHSEERREIIIANYYSFYQFLVESPFPVDSEEPIRSPAYGTYHQHYKVGDVLIAVGVVDILPTGFSSVYLFYHPSFSHDLVALGKFAILKEVEYTNQILKLPYYYLGYYIESCPKMRYKAEYKPSELLCPKHHQWVAVENAIPKLEKTPRHVCALVEKADEENNSQDLLHQLPMDIGAGMNVTFGMLQTNGKDVVRPILEDFIEAAGTELSKDCILRLT